MPAIISSVTLSVMDSAPLNQMFGLLDDIIGLGEI
jgi:hypothetical protein